jgi:DNA-directed RNA polymerase subunit RPC12/RpoP
MKDEFHKKVLCQEAKDMLKFKTDQARTLTKCIYCGSKLLRQITKTNIIIVYKCLDCGEIMSS